jgi:hypothetical protein
MRDILVCVAGCHGNMGRRYMAILKYLDIPHWGYDIEDYEYTSDDLAVSTHMIIATPTATHYDQIMMLHPFLKDKGRILCEKPISKNGKELEQVFNLKNLYMVNNYAYILPEQVDGLVYNYFKTGGDGLSYDCIQLFKFIDSPEKIVLLKNSPVWTLNYILNSKRHEISSSAIDGSYINMILDFLGDGKKLWDMQTALELENKIKNFILFQ